MYGNAYYTTNNNDNIFSFEHIMIIMLMGIIFFMYLKLEKCTYKENFSVDIDMNKNESYFSMKDKKFDMDCCNSKYTNDKGCICKKGDIPEIIRNRGGNNSV